MGKAAQDKKVRAGEILLQRTDGNRVLQGLRNESLGGGEAGRAGEAAGQHRLGAGHTEALRGPLGVEVHLRRLKDGLEHGERVEAVDRHADADQVGLVRLAGYLRTLPEERPQCFGRGVIGRVDRQDFHGLAGGDGRGKSTRAGATLAPFSLAPQLSSSRQTGPGA